MGRGGARCVGSGRVRVQARSQLGAANRALVESELAGSGGGVGVKMGALGVVARGANLRLLLLRLLGLLLLGLHLRGLLLQGFQLPRCPQAGQAAHVGSTSALHAHEPCMCTTAHEHCMSTACA